MQKISNELRKLAKVVELFSQVISEDDMTSDRVERWKSAFEADVRAALELINIELAQSKAKSKPKKAAGGVGFSVGKKIRVTKSKSVVTSTTRTYRRKNATVRVTDRLTKTRSVSKYT